MLTNQEIFDKTFNHAQAQHKEYGVHAQSYDEGSCKYRDYLSDERVKMCFIGPFIPSEDYLECMEGYTANNLFEHYPDMMTNAGLDKEHSHDLLSSLQNLHDTNNPDKWDQGFARIARNFKLECSIELEGEVMT